MAVIGYMGIGADKQESKQSSVEMKIGAVDMEKEMKEEAPKKPTKKGKKAIVDEE